MENEVQENNSVPAPIIEPSELNIILEYLSMSPIEIDELILCTGLSTSKVQIALLELKLAGRLLYQGQQLVSLAP